MQSARAIEIPDAVVTSEERNLQGLNGKRENQLGPNTGGCAPLKISSSESSIDFIAVFNDGGPGEPLNWSF